MKKLITSIFILILTVKNIIYPQLNPDWILTEIENRKKNFQLLKTTLETLPNVKRDNYNVTYYRIEIKVDIDSSIIYGNTLIKAISNENNLSEINLDFYGVGENILIDEFYENVRDTSISRNILKINLQTPVESGKIFTIGIKYHGRPAIFGNDGFVFDTHLDTSDSVNYPVIYTINEPYYARSWFPCKDVPNDKADSVDIFITVPDTLVAASNGCLVSIYEAEHGFKKYHWKENYPISTYLVAMYISNYYSWSQEYPGIKKMPIFYWVFPEDSVRAKEKLPVTLEMMEFFSSIWGEYPFINEKYGQVQITWPGGMENQTCTGIGSFDRLLICHELAHHWWGNMITCANWRNLWLNEGFARYAEALWLEHKYGKQTLHSYMNLLNRPNLWNNYTLYLQDTTNPAKMFDLTVYDKGAWVLHMLRKVVGDTNFFKIFKEYRKRFEYRSTTTEDFQRVCEYIYGDTLNWFFDQWVYSGGIPNYYITYRFYFGNDKNTVYIKINQGQAQSPFTMPLDIQIISNTKDTIISVWNNQRVQEYYIYLPETFVPESVKVDPDDWVLKTISYSNIIPELGYYPEGILLLQPFPNPFNDVLNIPFYIPDETPFRIDIYNLIGQDIETLVNNKSKKGYNKIIWNPMNIPSGIYFIKLKHKDGTLFKKVLYLK
ncbi:MAG: T9SS type A sorting domain-containing protein [Candidatus Marinimicrobia bacterium]|nr:T9SS type A sorting domain-containing protein [Candidatus Neomarinimicrobiota bacterium]